MKVTFPATSKLSKETLLRFREHGISLNLFEDARISYQFLNFCKKEKKKKVDSGGGGGGEVRRANLTLLITKFHDR